MAKRKTTKAETDDTKNKPYVSNYPPLRDWLHKHEAFCQWQLPLGPEDNPNAYVEMWQPSDGWPVVVIAHHNQFGWEIYTSHPTNDIEATLADADARIARRPPAPPPDPNVTTVTVTLKIVGGEADARAVVGEVLDSGVFQTAINDYDLDDGNVSVMSATCE